VLLDAFQMLAEDYPVRLVVAGYPAKHIDMPEIYKQVEQLGISEQLVFDLRYIPNEEVPALFELADVVVYPYLNSTQSGAIQVSYSFGRPVVASNIGGLPEVVDEGKSGLLAEPGDSHDLAEKIAVMLDNPARRKEMGAYARHLSETRFSWDTIASKILAVYQTLGL
jgi:glycosyltransferase involved in cell wall biosynthesis